MIQDDEGADLVVKKHLYKYVNNTSLVLEGGDFVYYYCNFTVEKPKMKILRSAFFFNILHDVCLVL